MWGDIAIAFLIACITAFVCTPYTMRLANRIGAMDEPKEKRKIHTKSTPRLGGLAVILGFLLSATYLIVVLWLEDKLALKNTDVTYIKLLGFFIGAFVVAAICFIDDYKGISPFLKLFAQIMGAVIVVLSGIRIEQIDIPFINQIGLTDAFANVITVLWIVIITNSINLIDGLDGLSSGVSLISCVSLLVVFSLNGSPIIAIILITALGGGLVGFLPFNLNPAKTFIGDTGTNFLGFSLAVISMLGFAKTYTAIVLIAPILIMAIPIFDTIFAIIRRVIKEKSIKAVFNADTGHVHHRLIKHGFTQKESVLILYAFSTALGLFTIILIESGVWKAISFVLLLIVLVAIGFNDIFKRGET